MDLPSCLRVIIELIFSPLKSNVKRGTDMELCLLHHTFRSSIKV